MPVKDTQDGYEFLYPFGWQEIAIDGQDVVFKDIIEPLESVSVNLLPTDKTDISEYGPLDDVVLTLADKVLTGPGQEVKIIAANEVSAVQRSFGVWFGIAAFTLPVCQREVPRRLSA